jgi:Tol biopolymer transport system component
MWFAATYGNPNTRGSGSNVPSWTRDGHILFPRRTPSAKVPWEYRTNQPDVDHFNRDFKPDLARGGTHLCRLDPANGMITTLTPLQESVWDFRCSESPDGKEIVFCRAATGETPAIWVMGSDGANARALTRGFENLGADHPRWIGKA